MPGFIGPQLATLKLKAPSGSRWIHYTRNGYNWVSKFSRIAAAFDLEGQAIFDGEVVVMHKGRTNFSELQAGLGRGDQDRLIYFCCGSTARICARSRSSSGRGCSRS
ncbi:hypothetical protein ACVWY3_000523 [Bradyrhizobium sp. USDA 4486]